MLLAIDVGNTQITLGLYERDVLGARWRLATDQERLADEYGILLLNLFQHAGAGAKEIHGVAIASVVPPLTAVFEQVCRDYLKRVPLIVGAGTKTGVRIKYEDPKQVGADRVVDAAAAHSLYGGPACIVDFGTATTFDAISGDGDYLGGAIAPGLEIAAEALFQRAAKLPKVDLQRPPSPIGRNVVQSLQSGLLFGYVSLVEGMVARFRAILGPEMKVIGTGSLAEVIARETSAIEILAPWLALEGLRLIHEMNER